MFFKCLILKRLVLQWGKTSEIGSQANHTLILWASSLIHLYGLLLWFQGPKSALKFEWSLGLVVGGNMPKSNQIWTLNSSNVGKADGGDIALLWLDTLENSEADLSNH